MTNLSAALRRTRKTLEPLGTRTPAAKRALDLLERDLLPRTAGGDAYLVVGIVGPNNSGKSALFNALVGHELSPSVATGGATRRLVGAAHPGLLESLRAEPTLARFPLLAFDHTGGRRDAVLQPSADPAELLVAAEPQLPPGLMLIDTPDFDSILENNRLASESLLAVADLVVAVVTRHSYQNRAVVRFLEQWFVHGRPWMLVYNEAADVQTAAAHTVKLAADVGTPPLAVFWAPHSMEVQRGEAALEPHSIGGEEGAVSPPPARATSASLRDMLFDLEKIAEVKSRAFEAARARLRDALDDVSAALSADAARARSVLDVAERRALEAGVQVSSAAMPAGPFVEAFRTVLDRRTNLLSRSWRATLRHIRLGLESAAALLRGRRPQEKEAPNLDRIELDALRKAWPPFWEEMVRDLGREARHAARRQAGVAMGELLDADLDHERHAEARQRAEQALGTRPADVEEFRSASERLIERAIEERGFDLDIQTAADVATLVPLALAAAVIVNTGGLGSDIAIAGGGAVSTFLIEKYTHLLGRGIMAEARRQWTEVRSRQLARVLTDAALPVAAPKLRQSAERDAEIAREVQKLKEAV